MSSMVNESDPRGTADASPADPQSALPPTRDVVRNAGRAVLSVHHWRARLVLWSAAVAVGVVAVVFARLADVAQLGLRRLLVISPWWPWLLAPPGFFCIAWLTRRYFRGAEGSGIPQTIFALKPDSGETGLRLLEPHVVMGS
jgi:H+/Cl- antiporter ClcA